VMMSLFKKRYYNARYNNRDARLLILSRWWGCFVRTSIRQKGQAVRRLANTLYMPQNLPQASCLKAVNPDGESTKKARTIFINLHNRFVVPA
jgi:hypothetical protein